VNIYFANDVMTRLTINTLEIISLKLLRTYLTSIRMLDQW